MTKLADLLIGSHTLAALRWRLGKRQRKSRRMAPTARAEWLKEMNPAIVPVFRGWAGDLFCGRMVLPGSGCQPVHVGDPPRWRDDPYGNVDYGRILNRMQHWPVLLQAYQLCGEPRYAERVALELKHWLDRCPCPAIPSGRQALEQVFEGPHPWRAVEVGIRMSATWPAVLEHLAAEPGILSDAVYERLLLSLHEHGAVLAELGQQLGPDADQHQYLLENLGLLTIAVLVPEFASAGRWFRQAVLGLERCALAQPADDGSRNEGVSSLHDEDVYWFTVSIRLARSAGVKLSKSYVDRIRQSVTQARHPSFSKGVSVSFVDADPDDGRCRAAIWWFDATGESSPLRLLAGIHDRQRTRQLLLGDCAWSVDDPLAVLSEIERDMPAPITESGLGALWRRWFGRIV